jgi:hypothetical protein
MGGPNGRRIAAANRTGFYKCTLSHLGSRRKAPSYCGLYLQQGGAELFYRLVAGRHRGRPPCPNWCVRCLDPSRTAIAGRNWSSDVGVPKRAPSGLLDGANQRCDFSTQSGDTSDLWEAGISLRTGKVSGVLRRLTAGAGNELEPSCASGDALAFTNVDLTRDVWSVPFDLDRGRAKGVLERITRGPSRREHSALSGNGRFVTFASAQSGPLEHLGARPGDREGVASPQFIGDAAISNHQHVRQQNRVLRLRKW